jgi:hypothetical protein
MIAPPRIVCLTRAENGWMFALNINVSKHLLSLACGLDIDTFYGIGRAKKVIGHWLV